MKGHFHMVTAFAVAFVLSRVSSAPVTQTYKTVRCHSNICNNNVITWSLTTEFYIWFSWLITLVPVNPAKFSQRKTKYYES